MNRTSNERLCEQCAAKDRTIERLEREKQKDWDDYVARSGEYLVMAQRAEARLSEANEALHDAAQNVAIVNNEVQRLRAALKRYGMHRPSCPIDGFFPPQEGIGYVCTCGFERAMGESGEHP